MLQAKGTGFENGEESFDYQGRKGEERYALPGISGAPATSFKNGPYKY